MISQIIKKIWFLWAICLIFNIVTLLLVYFKVSPNPGGIIVLGYNVILGVEPYGPANQLYLIPFAAFVISILNYIFYRYVKNTGMFYAPLVLGATFTIQLVLLFAVILIIQAN